MVNIFTILFEVMPNNQALLFINEPFCHQSRQNIGCRLTLSLVTNGMITGKKLAIVSEKMVHILIIHACHIVTALLVGIVINEIATETVQLVAGKPECCRSGGESNTHGQIGEK